MKKRNPVGGWAPDFVLPDAGGTPVRFFGRAGGRPTVLLVKNGDAEGLVEALEQVPRRDELAVWVINTQAPAANATLAGQVGDVPVLSDTEAAVCEMLGVADGVTALLLSPGLRVDAALFVEDGWGDQVSTWLDGAASRDPREVRGQAPALLVPDVLSAEACGELIELWSSDNHETGIETSRESGRENALVAEAKRRRDHVVSGSEHMQQLTQAVGRVLIPQLRKAFAYKASRFEGFKICCYDADASGFFAPHRDNLSPATAHRRFALSLNLNDDYEGGHLRFPEYGPELYRPGTGGAIVFSGSLLHEALPVTKGRRFVLLSFLFGDEGRRAHSHG